MYHKFHASTTQIQSGLDNECLSTNSTCFQGRINHQVDATYCAMLGPISRLLTLPKMQFYDTY